MAGRNKFPPKKHRNPVALKLLTDGMFRPKKEKNPKTYTRKTKHKKDPGSSATKC